MNGCNYRIFRDFRSWNGYGIYRSRGNTNWWPFGQAISRSAPALSRKLPSGQDAWTHLVNVERGCNFNAAGTWKAQKCHTLWRELRYMVGPYIELRVSLGIKCSVFCHHMDPAEPFSWCVFPNQPDWGDNTYIWKFNKIYQNVTTRLHSSAFSRCSDKFQIPDEVQCSVDERFASNLTIRYLYCEVQNRNGGNAAETCTRSWCQSKALRQSWIVFKKSGNSHIEILMAISAANPATAMVIPYRKITNDSLVRVKRLRNYFRYFRVGYRVP